MSSSPVTLKGSPFTLTVLYIQPLTPSLLYTALKEKVGKAPILLHQAPLVLNVSNLPEEWDWNGVKNAIHAAGLYLVAVSGCSNEKQKHSLTKAGLPLLQEGKKNTTQPIASKTGTSCLHIQQVRSGQQIYASEGDLIVMGSVSAGAEVIATGHIHIYGTLRGRAIAGAHGDLHCRIFCSNLQAELVAIAGHYWLSDQIPSLFWGCAATISQQQEQLVVEALHTP